MANVSEWSANELENLFLDDMNLSDERGRRAAKIMAAVKAKEDEQDAKLDAVAGGLVFRGTKATYAELEAVEDPAVGDMYSVTERGGENYAWDGTAWDSLGTSDANVVHKTGDETIDGAKTFSENIIGNVSFKTPKNELGTDLDLYTRTGFYCLDEITANSPANTISNGFLFVIANEGNWTKQVFFRYGTLDSNDHNAYMRTGRGTTTREWSTWRRIMICGGESNDLTTYANIVSGQNNTHNLGSSTYLWKQLYAATGTINTSDERLKQEIEPIPDSVLDAWSEIKWAQFKFKDAVSKKKDAARLHCGLVAQRIEAEFAAHGIDASAYGFFCHDSWDASGSDDDTVPAGDLYSLRYEEALCMEGAYQRRRADRLEARIAALEAVINGKQ